METMRNATPLKVGILGSGSIGCYLGGLMAVREVAEVVFVGRRSFSYDVATANGLSVSSIDEDEELLSSERVTIGQIPDLADCDYVIVTVKTDQTKIAGKSLAAVLDVGTVVVSLQNGVDNPYVLRKALPKNTVITGMIQFTVSRAGAAFHRNSGGSVYIQEMQGAETRLVEALRCCTTVPVITMPEIKEHAQGKLLLNFLNPINAIAGIPARQMLMDQTFRHIWATAVEEGLAAFKAAGIEQENQKESPLWMSLMVLRLPTPLFCRSFKPLATLDEKTKLTMLRDLEAGRPDKVDSVLGPAIEQARNLNIPTPTLDALSNLMHEAELSGKSPKLSSKELAAACGVEVPNQALSLSLKVVAFTGVAAGGALLLQRLFQ